VRKAYPRGSTDDLSFKALIALSCGLGLWIAYGVLRADYVIIGANLIGFLLTATLVAFVLRDRRGRERTKQ
jgi:MtN3 and saliva related transmembrane protein